MTTALLGTGTMGSGMAGSMLRAGVDLRVWNRSAEKAAPLAEQGATVAATVSEAVEGADVVVIMLYDADSVLEVLTQAQTSLATGALTIQSSTIGVEGVERVAAFAAEHGIALLDAPVLGTKQPAEQGNLVVLVSGDPTLHDRATETFDAIGSRTLWVGDTVGQASALKLACNAWIATITAAVGQSVALASGLGVDPQLFLDAITGSAVDTPYAHLKGAQMLAGEHPPSFALDGGVKDVTLIQDAAKRTGVNPVLIEAVLAAYTRASTDGHGAEDLGAVYEAFRPRT